MRTMKFTEDGIRLSEGLEAVMMVCERYARSALGEMVTQTDKGIPFFQAAFGRQPDIDLYEAWFRRRMREVSGVVSVREFSASVRGDELIYDAIIETVYGTGRLNNGRV